MNAAFAVLKNAGIKDSTISTGYRQALLEVFSPDEKTLNFLQSRYRQLGENLSKETIQAMFNGFTKSNNPLEQAINELNKLGYSTSAAAEFARLYDVRATNVLNVLAKQNTEMAKMTSQLQESGSAAQGTQTQMEALGKSWDNLGGIITTVISNAVGSANGGLDSVTGSVERMRGNPWGAPAPQPILEL